MFELSVLPADVDSQTLSVVLQCLFLTVFTHFLCVLGFLHLDETLKTDRQTVQSDRRVRHSQSDRRFRQRVLYLSLQPVGEILPDLSERLGQFQDVCVGEFTGGDLTDVDDLTGAALENQQRGVIKLLVSSD